MATPHVTGAAALLRAQNPSWTNQQIVDSLFARAEDLGTAGRDDFYGYGLVRPLRTAPPVTAPVPAISGPTSISAAGTYTWTASATGGNGSYTYSWEYRVQGGTWTSLGVSGASYSRTVATTDPSFELRVTATSAGLTGTASLLVSVTGSGPALSVSVGGDSYLYPGDVGYWYASVTGGNGTVSYQWQYRTSTTTTWTNVGTNSPSYSRSAPLRSFYVRVIATSGGVSATSNSYLVTVESEPMCGQYLC
jgi:hypothetical protein